MKVTFGEKLQGEKHYGEVLRAEREGYYVTVRSAGYYRKMPIEKFMQRIREKEYVLIQD